MATIFLALGSNVGDSQAHIEKAIELLGEKVGNITRAPIYISKAVGFTEQPDFLNTAIKGQTDLKPRELLRFVKDVEQKVGRIQRFRWGPREIDVDIIFYASEVMDKPGLTIPHPRFKERDFVLKPICDLNPEYVDPLTRLSVQTLLSNLPESDLSIKS